MTVIPHVKASFSCTLQHKLNPAISDDKKYQ